MQHYTTEEACGTRAHRQAGIINVKHVPLKIEVQPSRKWRFSGRKGYTVRVQVLNEHGVALHRELFVTSLQGDLSKPENRGDGCRVATETCH